jgi:fusaric acid resistance family protein
MEHSGSGPAARPEWRIRMTSAPIVAAFREALVTMLAALATMACALAIDPEPGPAVLAVVLCVALSRSQLDRDARGRLEAALVLPAVSVAALGVGLLLRHAPWLGAALFVAGVSVPIALRGSGPALRRAGALVALPFVVILVTPRMPAVHANRTLALLMPIVVALLALAWVTLAHAIARRIGWLAQPQRAWSHASAADPPAAAGSLRPSANTRMAIQMAVALAAAFVVGYLLFRERWAWIVLTAYIVGSANQGRLDVLYKSVQRVLGAAAGTGFALVLSAHATPQGSGSAVAMLAAVFLGVWLRPLGYAWWALFVTVALALLQGFEGPSAGALLGLRLEEIAMGALIGVAAAWLVLPVRSTGVLRRRIADALAALAGLADPEQPDRSPASFAHALDRAEKVAPAFRAVRGVTRRYRSVQPADWIDALAACRAPALALIERGAIPAPVRKALGAARKAMREPAAIGPALEELRAVLARAAALAPASAGEVEPRDPHAVVMPGA